MDFGMALIALKRGETVARKIDDVKNDTPSVPYYSEVPENAGVLFEIGQEQTFFFLDFYF